MDIFLNVLVRKNEFKVTKASAKKIAMGIGAF